MTKQIVIGKPFITDAVKAAHPKLEQTLTLIKLAHQTQLYNNRPYWHHPVRVMLRLGLHNPKPFHVDSPLIYAALLHDTIEDTLLTADDLRLFGYSDRTIELVQAVTRDKEEQSYKEFIHTIRDSKDFEATRLKLADLHENSNCVRFLPVHKRTVMVRYGKSIEDLMTSSQVMEAMMKYKLNNFDHFVYPYDLDDGVIGRWIGETEEQNEH